MKGNSKKKKSIKQQKKTEQQDLKGFQYEE